MPVLAHPFRNPPEGSLSNIYPISFLNHTSFLPKDVVEINSMAPLPVECATVSPYFLLSATSTSFI